MAIANSDGSIILSTKVDTSGMEQGTKSLKSQAAKLAAEYRKAGMSQSEAFKKAWSQIDKTKTSTDKATISTKKWGQQAKQSGNTAKTSFVSVAGVIKTLGAYISTYLGVFALINFSKAASEMATTTETSVQRLIDIYGDASNSLTDFIDANSHALGLSKSAAATYSSVYGNLFSVWADQETNADLTAQYLNMTAVVASKTGRTMEDVQERIRSGLLGNTEAVEDLGIFVNVKTIEMTEAFQRVADGRSWEQLTAQEQGQVRALAILEQSTEKYGDTVADNAALQRSQYNAAFEDFKNTWGQVINLILLPVLNFLTKVFSIATYGINALLGKSGKLSEQVNIQASGTEASADNQKDLKKEVEKTGKAMKKTLAGFDDLQILTEAAAENMEAVEETASSGGISPTETTTTPFEPVDTSGGFDVAGAAQNVSDAINMLLPVIEIGLVALGFILLTIGQIPWGIGFIVAGAYLYSVDERSGGESFDVAVIKEDLQALADHLHEVLAVIGVILLFLGQIPWGIGFIVAGAIVYGVKELQSGEYDTADFKTKLAVMTEAVSLAMVAIGIMLIFFGNVPLGLGFIAVGYKLLKVSEQQLHENDVVTDIQKFLTDAKDIIIGLSMIALVLGVILLVSGVTTPLTLGLVVAGAVGLASEQEATGEDIGNLITTFLKEHGELIAGLGMAMLLLGVVVLMAGGITHAPLGIALVIAGMAGVVAPVVVNWGIIYSSIKSTFEEHGNLIAGLGTAMLIIGILLLFVPGMIGAGLGFIVAGGAMTAAAVAFNWDSIVDGIKDAGESVKTWWKDNMAAFFTTKWWQNLAIDCGNGLIAGFEAAVNGIGWLFEKMINLVIGLLNKIQIELPDWDWLGDLAGAKFGVDIKEVDFKDVEIDRIPKLARGAVIPGNREFLAVLGDQPAGQTNIEAPAELIKQMAMEAIAESQTQQPIKEEHYYIDEQRLMSIVYKLVQGGKRLNGDSLITEGGLA